MENLYLGMIFISFVGLSALYFSERGRRKRLEDANEFLNGARKDWTEKYMDLRSQYGVFEDKIAAIEKQNTDLKKSRNRYKARLIRREKRVKTLLTKTEKNG